MGTLLSQTVRLAYEKPELRGDLLPLIKNAWKSMAFPRDFHLPKDNPTLKKVETPAGLEIWTYESPNANGGAERLYGIAFMGKANKPLWNYSFRSPAEREKTIADTVRSWTATQAAKAKRMEERKLYVHDYKVGDILTGSWGYDQTNIEFFEVVATPTPKTIAIREVGQKVVREERGADYVVATPGKYTGPVFKKTPGVGGSVKMESFSLHKWDGKPRYQTAAGWGH